MATPRWVQETALWAATTPGEATYPKPMPITKQARARCHKELWPFTETRITAPATAMTAPRVRVKRKPSVR